MLRACAEMCDHPEGRQWLRPHSQWRQPCVRAARERRWVTANSGRCGSVNSPLHFEAFRTYVSTCHLFYILEEHCLHMFGITSLWPSSTRPLSLFAP